MTKSQLPRLLALLTVTVATQLRADEPVLYARQGDSRSEAVEAGNLYAANQSTSRSVAAPAGRPAAPPSRQDSGIVARTTVHEVLSDQSYIVLKSDAETSHYRLTRNTQVVDERGRAVSLDRVKSGINATLYYTRGNEEATLTKVIVNSEPRPLHGGNLQARVDE